MTIVCATLMINVLFQGVSADYNTGDDFDIFTDELGNKNMVWREQINDTYQVFYGYEIVDDIYNENNITYSNQTINDNIDFDDGYLTIQNCNISGNLDITQAQVLIENCDINGNIKHTLGSLIIKSTDINGIIDVKNADLELRTSYVNGNVKTKTNTQDSYSVILTGNEINGNVDLKSGICYVVGNAVNNNLKVKDPAIIQEVSDNDVDGNTQLTDNTSGFDGCQITNSTLDVMYPQVAIDNTSDMGYVLWVIDFNGTLELWYIISPDMILWLEPRYGGIMTNTTGNPELDMDAINGTLYVTWENEGSLTIDPDYNNPPNLRMIEMGADKTVVHLNETATISLKMDNIGLGSALFTVINVTDIVKENETLIYTTEIPILRPDGENMCEFNWTPMMTGIHYLEVEILSKHIIHQSPAKIVDGPPTIMSVGIPVSTQGDEEIWGPGGQGAGYHDDIIISSDRYRDGPLTIYIESGDLEILSDVTLQLNDSVTLVMVNPTRGQYGIDISAGGKFIIDSSTESTTIQTPSTPAERELTYPVHNNGTLDFEGVNVMYTYGDIYDITESGGIQNHPGSVCNLTDCWLVDGDTHSICADNSDVNISGSETLIGKGDKSALRPIGTGLTAVGNSMVTVEDVTFDYNEEYGIKCINADNVELKNDVNVKNSKKDGIYLDNSDIKISDIKVHDNVQNGIYCAGSSAPIIERSNISWNGIDGLYYEDSTPILQDNNIMEYNGQNGIRIRGNAGVSGSIDGNQINNNMESGIWCDDVEVEIANNTISSNGMRLIYRDDMEDDDWTEWPGNSSLWHPVSNESGRAPPWNLSHSGDQSWWFGNDNTGNYDIGTSVHGILTSKYFDLLKYESASLVFWSWYETDNMTDCRKIILHGFDVETKEIELYGDEMKTWTRHVINISDYAGHIMRFKFDFNTVDNLNNNFQGWYIDDVEIIGSYPAVEGHGIHVEGDGLVKIVKNELTLNNWHGIEIIRNSPVTIENCLFSNNLRNGIQLFKIPEDNSFTLRFSEFKDTMDSISGINAFESFVNISNCTFDGKHSGITTELSGLNIESCEFSNYTSHAIETLSWESGTRHMTLINSTINNCVYGISSRGTAKIEIIKCEFNDCQVGFTGLQAGLYMNQCTMDNVAVVGGIDMPALSYYGNNTFNFTGEGMTFAEGAPVYFFNNTFNCTGPYPGAHGIHRNAVMYVENCTFTGNLKTGIELYNAGVWFAGSDALISNSTFSGMKNCGIVVGKWLGPKIINNTFENIEGGSHYQGGGEGACIAVNKAEPVLIEKNVFVNSLRGVKIINTKASIYNSSFTDIEEYSIKGESISKEREGIISGNFIDESTSNCLIGIFLNNASTMVKDNQIMKQTDAIFVNNTHNLTIHNNSMKYNSCGMRIYYSNNSLFSNNSIMTQAQTIYLLDSNNNTLRNNSIHDNLIGVSLAGMSSNNDLYHNNFINQLIEAIDLGENNWDNGFPSGGNFWDDYRGIDLNTTPSQDVPPSDGLGDTPYIIDSDSQDNYPLMAPWPSLEWTDTTPFRIDSDAELINFVSSRGLSGNGSRDNPYIIEYYNIDGSKNGTCIYIGNTTQHFIIQNCRLYNANGYYSSSYYLDSGVYLFNTRNGTIKDNMIFANNVYGIHLDQSQDNIISKNLLFNNGGEGVHLNWYSKNNTVESNLIHNNAFGIYALEYSNDNKITDNFVHDNDVGIWVNGYSSENLISMNKVTDNRDYGIVLGWGTNDNYVFQNEVENNGGYGGLYLQQSTQNKIANNIMVNNTYGIYADSSSNNIFINNSLIDNSEGFKAYESNYNRLYHNNFINNTVQATDNGMNYWNASYPLGGNYWSDYSGIDLNGTSTQDVPPPDGFGDTPYTIVSESAFDYYPLMDISQTPEWATFNLSLSEGLNLISFPFEHPRINGTDVLWGSDLADLAEASEVSFLNAETQSLTTFVPGTDTPQGVNDFIIDVDHSYWINVTENKTIEMAGLASIDPRIVKLYSGWNPVGFVNLQAIPNGIEELWAPQVSCGGTYDDIAYWDIDRFEHYIFPNTQNVLVPGLGYYVYSDNLTYLVY